MSALEVWNGYYFLISSSATMDGGTPSVYTRMCTLAVGMIK